MKMVNTNNCILNGINKYMKQKNTITTGLEVSTSENSNILPASESRQASGMPFDLSRRKVLGGLVGLGVLSVLDNGCYSNEGCKAVTIGFEPFKEGEKKEWKVPEQPMDDTQINDFLKQVLPSIFGKDGTSILELCKFRLIDNVIRVDCNKFSKKLGRELQQSDIKFDNNNGSYSKAEIQEDKPKFEVIIPDIPAPVILPLNVENIDGGILICNENWCIILQYLNNSLRIYGNFIDKDYINRIEYICDGDGNFGYFDSEDKYYVEIIDENDDLNRFFINNFDTSMRLLQKCNNPEILRAFLDKTYKAKTPLDFSDIKGNLQIRELLRLVPEEMQNKMILSAFRYHQYDRGESDEYRPLLDILQSGWGDCDDFSVANTVWAYTHGYEPFVVDLDEISKNSGCSNIIGEYLGGHAFIYFVNSDNQTMVCDNQEWSILGKSQTIYDYIEKYYSEYSLDDIHKVPVRNGKMIFEL